jgi:hypothetical protein
MRLAVSFLWTQISWFQELQIKSYKCLKFLREVWAGRACIGANQQELTTCAKSGGKREKNFKKKGIELDKPGISLYPVGNCCSRPAAGRLLACHALFLFIFYFYFWKFWEWARALDVQHPDFLNLAPTLGSVKCSNPHGDSTHSRFHFFFNFFFLNLEFTWTFISTIGIFVSWKSEITKNSSRFTSIMEIFVPFFSARCIWVCSTHYLPLRFGTQVPNLMCITMVQKLKVA